MKLYTVITCIGSLILALTGPAASVGNWAFDPASCTAADVQFLQPQMERATTIGKLAAKYYPKIPNPLSGRGRPKFDNALLGRDSKYARAVFNGGSVIVTSFGTGGARNAKGIKNLNGQTAWTSARSSGNIVRIPCDVKENHSTGFQEPSTD